MESPSASAGPAGERILRGIGVSPGIAVGRVFLCAPPDDRVTERDIPREGVAREIARFEAALIATRGQIRAIQKDSDPDVAGIFDAHLLFLDDGPFIKNVFAGIEGRRKNVEVILRDVAQGFAQSLVRVKDDYLRERAGDVLDVARRIQNNLIGKPASLADIRAPGQIVVANDLSPSDTVGINRDLVAGMALDLGSPTSHTAVVAAKLGIPAVVGLRDISRCVQAGEEILVDGGKGVVVLRPSAERRALAQRQTETRRGIEIELGRLRDLPAETTDGYRIVLSGNIELPQDAESVLAGGAEGVGLFRTEYLYLTSKELPSEEQQVEAYRSVAERLAPAPVIIRTLDLGGDKFLSHLDLKWQESNPFMGWRAIRFCLAQPDLFRTQLRALLRASIVGNIKIMYPMISNLDEIVRANGILEQAKQELLERGHPFNPHIEIGAMIEVPAAALVADMLAPYVSFFSLGTNDLVQYTLAIDRGNERVAYLYEPTHLAILRLIKKTVDTGHRFGIWTGLCGGMASDPLMAPLLLGLGLDELSVPCTALPRVKDAIRRVSLSESREMADLALSSSSSVDLHDVFRTLTQKIAPEILELVE